MKELMQDIFSSVASVEAAMKKKGWNAAKLARQAHVTEADVSRLLNKTHDIRASKLYAILGALNLLNVDGSNEPNDIPWALKALIESQSKRIDEAHQRVTDMKAIITRYKDEVEKMWGVINAKDGALESLNNSLTTRIDAIRADMDKAAEKGDVKILGRVGEAGK